MPTPLQSKAEMIRMMLLKNAIEEIGGLRFIAEGLELHSGPARRVLLGGAFMRDAEQIATALDEVAAAVAIVGDESKKDDLLTLDIRLGQVRDIRGSLGRLAAGTVLDDIDLFEIKGFALAADQIGEMLLRGEMTLVAIPATAGVLGILDPEGQRLPHFAVYDAFSPELAQIRDDIKREKQQPAPDDRRLEELYARNSALEDVVRQRLSEELFPHAAMLEEALEAVARLDILLAKARQARAQGLTRPVLTDGETSYAGLWNPMVREFLRELGRDYQPVDIALGQGPCLITGANMGGKTVLLKTVALAQGMCQYGFYVPAEAAQIAPVDEILLSIGDEQDERTGLSSFAAEMVRLDRIIAKVRSGARPLVLIDEPARTTNPAEGEAIVSALVDLLAESRVRALVTTHYGGVAGACRRLKVKGLAEDTPQGVTSADIGNHMDYSLVEAGSDAPREAIRIARMLGVDNSLIDKAETYLKQR